VANVSDPENENYKFSRKFELSVLGEELIDNLNKNFLCTKIELPAEADMKIARNQARIEIWSPTEKKVGVIGHDQVSLLNKTPFLGFLSVRAAKSKALVKAEIARIEKLRKERDEKKAPAKKETAKSE
jgi:hypothetical protein